MAARGQQRGWAWRYFPWWRWQWWRTHCSAKRNGAGTTKKPGHTKGSSIRSTRTWTNSRHFHRRCGPRNRSQRRLVPRLLIVMRPPDSPGEATCLPVLPAPLALGPHRWTAPALRALPLSNTARRIQLCQHSGQAKKKNSNKLAEQTYLPECKVLLMIAHLSKKEHSIPPRGVQ